MAWFIGLMSGTSLDGVDGVLARTVTPTAARRAGSTDSALAQLVSCGHAHVAFDAKLRAQLLALNRSADDELHRAALAANALVVVYAQVVAQLLQGAALSAAEVRALGAHGQTVRHRPGEFDGHGYTLQLMNGALLAELTGIPVVCDFRSRDVAAGGQGAPLVPAFHASCWARPGQHVAVLNVGGIANLTLLGAAGEVLGFDTGPGNLLMDLWCQRHRGQTYDRGGAWAAAGQVQVDLLAALLSDSYLQRPPPKSTGRDWFDAAWLDRQLVACRAVPQDVMATLAEFTALTVVQALQRHAPNCSQLLVCGGGAFNLHLMGRLAALLSPAVTVGSTDTAGMPPDQVEAMAFAWLAQAHVEHRAGNLPAVTGARGPRLLGAYYPAG
jgi:anhydro-N-acetylmuramic acid kinase